MLLSDSVPHTSPPLFVDDLLWMYPYPPLSGIEGLSLHSAIWKTGRGTALIGPEIAEETRMDLEGQGKEGEG